MENIKSHSSRSSISGSRQKDVKSNGFREPVPCGLSDCSLNGHLSWLGSMSALLAYLILGIPIRDSPSFSQIHRLPSQGILSWTPNLPCCLTFQAFLWHFSRSLWPHNCYISIPETNLMWMIPRYKTGFRNSQTTLDCELSGLWVPDQSNSGKEIPILWKWSHSQPCESRVFWGSRLKQVCGPQMGSVLLIPEMP